MDVDPRFCELCDHPDGGAILSNDGTHHITGDKDPGKREEGGGKEVKGETPDPFSTF